MGLFGKNIYITHIHVHLPVGEILSAIESIHKQNLKIMGQVENLKLKMQEQGAALNLISQQATEIQGSVTGVQGDVKGLKEKIAQLQSAGEGATPEQVTELLSLADQTSENINLLSKKISEIGQQTAALDAATENATA